MDSIFEKEEMMARLFPFAAYRYDPERAGDPNLLYTQPYDKISDSLQEEYYARSEYNIIRITKNQEQRQNPETDYSNAGSTLESWMKSRVLVRDSSPAIYPYYQRYSVEGEEKVRKGFVALLDLRHAGSGILPHEHTMTGPKMDRLRLMRRLECNEDSIFMLYTDDKLSVNRILDAAANERPPLVEVKDDFGVVHQVWSLTDARGIKGVQDAMVPEELFIADGHHRYETALNYLKECEARGWKPAGMESFDKRMVTCFNSADRGLTILPTHRLLRDLPGFQSGRFLRAASQYFEIRAMDSPEGLWNEMKQAWKRGHGFGFYPADDRRPFLLLLKEEAKVDPFMLAHGEAYRHLDVSILHTLVLDKLLGIDPSKLASQAHIDYARDKDACLRRVNEGSYQGAFFLNPTTVEQVQRVAVLGEKMPQKSTDFYPKLLSGLLFMKMEITK